MSGTRDLDSDEAVRRAWREAGDEFWAELGPSMLAFGLSRACLPDFPFEHALKKKAQSAQDWEEIAHERRD